MTALLVVIMITRLALQRQPSWMGVRISFRGAHSYDTLHTARLSKHLAPQTDAEAPRGAPHSSCASRLGKDLRDRISSSAEFYKACVERPGPYAGLPPRYRDGVAESRGQAVVYSGCGRHKRSRFDGLPKWNTPG
jgi:hypothetical protein